MSKSKLAGWLPGISSQWLQHKKKELGNLTSYYSFILFCIQANYKTNKMALFCLCNSWLGTNILFFADALKLQMETKRMFLFHIEREIVLCLCLLLLIVYVYYG